MFPSFPGNKQRGFSVVEILVSIAVMAIALVGLLGLISFSLKVSTLLKQTDQANVLLKEQMEALRSFRDGTNWAVNGLGAVNLGAANPYHLEKSGSSAIWALVAGEETDGIFQKKIVFESVWRDASDNIAAVGVLDSDTKKITVTVSWPGKEIKLSAYLTNWRQ